MIEPMEVDTPAAGAEKPPPDKKTEPSATPDVIVLDDDDPGKYNLKADVIDLVGQASVGDRKCINYLCQSGVNLITPPVFCLSYYRVKNDKVKNQKICQQCYNKAVRYYDELVDTFTEKGSIMDVDFPVRNETFAIDDSDEEEEDDKGERVMVDPDTIKMLEEHFDDVMEECKQKVDYEEKVDEAIRHLQQKYEANNDSYLEVKTMLESIRKEVDSMLLGLFNTLRVENHSLPEYMIPDDDSQIKVYTRKTSATEISTKPKDASASTSVAFQDSKTGETTDVPMEPPKDLPPRGTLIKPQLAIGTFYYTPKNPGWSSWVKVKLESVSNKNTDKTVYNVSREHHAKTTSSTVTGRQLAYSKTLDVALEVGCRVIALFKEYGELKMSKRDAYYPGVVGESPTQYNKFRYLIFFDDGYAYYVHYNNVFLIFESSKNVWEDVSADSQAFIKKYITEYPNRSMVKLLKNQTVRTEFRGKWYVTTVMNIDCSLVQMFFDSQSRVEWIYRGSRRLNTMYKEEQAAHNKLQNRNRIPRAAVSTTVGKAPYVQYTRDDPDVIFVSNDTDKPGQQRSVAKKSTRPPAALPPTGNLPPQRSFLPVNEGPPGKIVYYTPRKQTPNTTVFRPHNCNDSCHKDVNTPLQRLRGYGPLAKPLLCGFYRIHYKVKNKKPFVVYKTPCGRTVRSIEELHMYLYRTKSQLTVDLFNFDSYVRCLAEFILEPNNPIIKDLSAGTEDIQIPVVNYVDSELNNFVNYSTKRNPMEGVHLNLDPDFLTGCNCEDDCMDRQKCSCWQLTLEGIKYLDNKDENEIGYHYRRLFDPIFTGIYECNSRCKCAKTCLNRVVQNPMQHKLQVFKTPNRGWGIRSINDIPQGSFICIYAGALLTEQMANEGGKKCGDEYFAELDYIEIVEAAKEGYEDDAYESEDDKKDESASGEDEEEDEDEKEQRAMIEKIRKRMKGNLMVDMDFIPSTAVKQGGDCNIRTRLRKRALTDVEEKFNNVATKKTAPAPASIRSEDDDTVTISDDDEEIREPSSFNPAVDDDDDEKRKYPSVRTMFGKDERVYIMDAKNTGNIGRYLNHSCSPNVFVQNVFVDTHDLRFPWVSFFASCYIRAGTELTWNYNYDIGSVEGKVMYCRCGSAECKGRLL